MYYLIRERVGARVFLSDIAIKFYFLHYVQDFLISEKLR